MGVLGAKPPRRTNHRQTLQAIGLHCDRLASRLELAHAAGTAPLLILCEIWHEPIPKTDNVDKIPGLFSTPLFLQTTTGPDYHWLLAQIQPKRQLSLSIPTHSRHQTQLVRAASFMGLTAVHYKHSSRSDAAPAIQR